MKSIPKLAAFSSLLLSVILVPRPGKCFYNSSEGRWLNRDPIEEIGGHNIYSFARNAPTKLFDLDGRMTLREYPTELPQPPTSGPYTDYNGLTWFNAFEPEAKIYKSVDSPCCWKIFMPGHADLYYWWVKNAPGHDPGTTAKDHEMQRVAIHRDTYRSFVASASDYIGPCFLRRKAECWRDVINTPLKDAWLAHNHTANLQLDARYRESEIPQAIAEEEQAWDNLAKETDKCASME